MPDEVIQPTADMTCCKGWRSCFDMLIPTWSKNPVSPCLDQEHQTRLHHCCMLAEGPPLAKQAAPVPLRSQPAVGVLQRLLGQFEEAAREQPWSACIAQGQPSLQPSAASSGGLQQGLLKLDAGGQEGAALQPLDGVLVRRIRSAMSLLQG